MFRVRLSVDLQVNGQRREAVFQATGKRVRELPITAEKLL